MAQATRRELRANSLSAFLPATSSFALVSLAPALLAFFSASVSLVPALSALFWASVSWPVVAAQRSSASYSWPPMPTSPLPVQH